MDMSDSDAEPGEPTAKRARTGNQPANGDSAPKWCNPDPYDALPPVEDTDKKKKDMVQLIRKARVQATSGSRASLPALPEDEDFIRCDSDSDEHDDKDDGSDDVFIDPLTYNRGNDIANAQGAAAATAAPRPAAPQTISTLPPKPVFTFTSGSGQVAPSAGNGNSRSAAVIDLTKSSDMERKKRPAAVIDLTQSSDLGTRKRTHDDVLKLPSHAKLKPATKQPVGGKMVREWQPKPGQNSHPWVRDSEYKAHVNVR